MSITSIEFLLFILIVIIVYYLVPKRFQWCILLISSLLFYSFSGVGNVLYILITASSAFVATRIMQSISDKQVIYLKENKEFLSKDEKSAIKKQNKKKRKWVMVACLVLNFSILCVFKYYNFALEQINTLISAFRGDPIKGAFDLIVPLGISFYTFQTMGYLVDVYWEKYKAENNGLKVLLFVSFFPQITQGPISDFKQLSSQLFSQHEFDYHNYAYGCQRMLWGFFKKLVIADRLAPYIALVTQNYSEYAGPTVLLGALMYSLQIYADFSGYMDIVCGFSEILGIHLTENFNRPYFSKSIAEYWRRWHISLGAWFKTYIYYPIAVSKWCQNLGKKSQKRLGKLFGQTVPASIALVVVWLTTGLWHGASWAYIAWGGVNGLFIIVSLWLEPFFVVWKEKLHIREKSFWWRAFQTLRTFFLVTLIKIFPEVGTLEAGFGFWKHIFMNWSLTPHFRAYLLPQQRPGDYLIIAVCAVMILVTSLIQRKQSIRDWLRRIPLPLRLIIFVVMFLAIVYFGVPMLGNSGGFLYAQF